MIPKKIFLTSIVAISFAIPAMADDVFSANQTYPESCESGVLYSSSGQTSIATANFEPNTYSCAAGEYLAANATACSTCPDGSFCPGGNYTFNETSANGATACPEGYTHSDSGASVNTQCYKACDVANFSHAATTTGNDYYGAGTDTCAIATCETGYSVGTQNSQSVCIANTISVRWGDKDGNVHETNQCTYNGTLTTPTTEPEAPRGYHFIGWTFPVPKYNFLVLVYNNATSYAAKNADGSVSNDADGLNLGEWKTTWNDYGTVKGTTMCSSTGNNGEFVVGGTEASLDNTGDKKSCWCKMTGFTDNDGMTYNQSSLWTFRATNDSAESCTKYCAVDCGRILLFGDTMRSGMFGSVD